MQKPIREMIDFFEKRTIAHIQIVNYLAGLSGRSFPEHDKSRFLGPELENPVIRKI